MIAVRLHLRDLTYTLGTDSHRVLSLIRLLCLCVIYFCPNQEKNWRAAKPYAARPLASTSNHSWTGRDLYYYSESHCSYLIVKRKQTIYDLWLESSEIVYLLDRGATPVDWLWRFHFQDQRLTSLLLWEETEVEIGQINLRERNIVYTTNNHPTKKQSGIEKWKRLSSDISIWSIGGNSFTAPFPFSVSKRIVKLTFSKRYTWQLAVTTYLGPLSGQGS